MDDGMAGRRRRSTVALLLAVCVAAAGLAACDETSSDDSTRGTNGDTPAAGEPGSNPEYLAILVEELRTGTRTERVVAAGDLGSLGDPAAIPALLEALDDEDWEVREAVAAALRDIPDKRAVLPLLALIETEPAPPGVREDDLWAARDAYAAAIAALGALGDPRAVPRLVAIAVDEETRLDRDAASAAIEAIGADGLPGVQEVLAAAPAATAPAVVAILARYGEPALEPLVAALKDKRAGVRVAAAAELGAFGDPAYAPLVAALGGKGDDLRSAAARSLGTIGDAGATNGLVALLADSGTRRAAVAALVAIHGDDATPLVKYLKKKATVQVYRPLIRIGQPDTVPALVTALEKFGTKTMGETYLNAGEPRLEKAAKKWAAKHGYVVVPSAGAGEEAWGER